MSDLLSGRVNRVELRKAPGEVPELIVDGKPVEFVTGFRLQSVGTNGRLWEATISFHTSHVILDLDASPEPPNPHEIEDAEERGFSRGFAAYPRVMHDAPGEPKET
jgi:hypothetical protein